MVLSNYVFFVHVYENFMDVSKTESFYVKQTCDFEKLVMKSLFLGVTSLSRKRYIIFLVLLTLFFDYNFVAIPLIELQVCKYILWGSVLENAISKSWPWAWAYSLNLDQAVTLTSCPNLSKK